MTTSRSRRRVQTSLWQGEQRDAHLDGFFSAIRDQASHELGRDDITIGTDADRLIVGLPLPALCLRVLFQSTVFPLSRISQLTGEEGSCKTAFLNELARWHFMYGGGYIYGETENKDAPELRASIHDWNPLWMSRTHVVPCYVLEDWQSMLSTYIGLAATQQDAPGGPGRTIPIFLGVDSLMAVAPREEAENTQKEGYASRGFALAANLISRYMRALPKMIKKYPFSIAGTNHLKPSTDFMGRPTSTVPGGKAVKFMETFEIEMHRAPGGDIDKLEYGGVRVKFVMRKNSLGPSRKQIVAELLWWYTEENGMVRQRTMWDWHTASIELLLNYELLKGKKTVYNHLMDIVDIQVTDKPGRKARSRALGINEPTDYRVLGRELENRFDLLHQIHGLLGVSTHPVFQPGVDYQQQLEAAAQANMAERQQAIAAYHPHTDEDAPVLSARDMSPEAVGEVAPEAEQRPEDNEDDQE